MRPPEVTVAVVSWNTRELLLRCLDSLAPEVAAGRAEVWVTDNGSSDGSADAAARRAPWARIVSLPENPGFGRAVNLIAERTESPWLLVANADMALTPGALEAMCAAGDGDPRRGAIAPRLLLPGGTTQHSAFALPTFGFTLWRNLARQRRDPAWGEAMCLEGHWDPERARAVPWAIAACLLLRRSAFTAVSGFDDRQWMYAEDLDLGWRLADAGWLTYFEPAAQVHHASGAATELAFGDARRRRFMRETYAVIARRRGVLRMQATAAVACVGALARIVWLAPGAVVRSGHRRALAQAVDWLRAHAQGLRPSAASPRPSTGTGPPTMDRVVASDMRNFWNARAREDALYFVDNRRRYRTGDARGFWTGDELLDFVFDALEVRLSGRETVLDIGCGVGRLTRPLAARADQVIALDVSDEMLERARALNPELANVTWQLGDGRSLEGVATAGVGAAVSLVVFQHLPDPEIVLGYVRELGRVLVPGGWAALQVSDDRTVHTPRDGLRQRLLSRLGRAPRGQRHPAWLGSAADLDALASVAGDSGLEVERVWGRGTQYCLLLLRRVATS